MNQKTSAFLRGIGSVVGLHRTLERRESATTRNRNPWAADAKAIKGDFEKAIRFEEKARAIARNEHANR
jgi:hypothetical protein